MNNAGSSDLIQWCTLGALVAAAIYFEYRLDVSVDEMSALQDATAQTIRKVNEVASAPGPRGPAGERGAPGPPGPQPTPKPTTPPSTKKP